LGKHWRYEQGECGELRELPDVTFVVNGQTGFHRWFLSQKCARAAFVARSHIVKVRQRYRQHCELLLWLQKYSREAIYWQLRISNSFVTFVACCVADCVKRFRLRREAASFVAGRKFREE